jgi:hypothetical protein
MVLGFILYYFWEKLGVYLEKNHITFTRDDTARKESENRKVKAHNFYSNFHQTQ